MPDIRTSRRLSRGGWQRRLLVALLWTPGCSSAVLDERPTENTSAAVRPQSTNLHPASSSYSESPIQNVRHDENVTPSNTPSPVGVPISAQHPIDLPTAFRLAGANNLQIALAGERIRQAQARLEGAKAQWLPSLNAGLGYNYHDGRVQDTRGEIIETRRNALFVGGGPNLGPASLTGPGGPPARLFLGLPLSEALFAPLAERQLVRASDAASAAAFNDTLLSVAMAYLDLVFAHSQITITDEAVKNAEELLRLVEARVRAGTAPPADGLRAQAELAERQRQRFQTEEAVQVTSAELVRLLRLDPAVTLLPLEGEPTPVCLIEPGTTLPALLAQGIQSRPELAENQALVQATLERLRQEEWRPWLPALQVGMSAGGFGGGEGSFFGNFAGRGDFDALLVWELKNLGFGNRALQRERASQNVQTRMTAEQLADTVAAQIVRAYYQVQFRDRQIGAARDQLKAAAEAVPLNFKGIVGGELRTIEGQQAVQTLAFARSQYLAAVIDYNRAQYQLLRATGLIPEAARANKQ